MFCLNAFWINFLFHVSSDGKFDVGSRKDACCVTTLSLLLSPLINIRGRKSIVTFTTSTKKICFTQWWFFSSASIHGRPRHELNFHGRRKFLSRAWNDNSDHCNKSVADASLTHLPHNCILTICVLKELMNWTEWKTKIWEVEFRICRLNPWKSRFSLDIDG